jgi:hypothetical protein
MPRVHDASIETATHQRKSRSGPLATSLPTDGRQRLITVQQARAEYGPPEATFREAVLRGDLKRVAFPGGRRWWLDRRDVERFLETSKRSGGEAA